MTARLLCDSAAKLTTTSTSCSSSTLLDHVGVADVGLHERDAVDDLRGSRGSPAYVSAIEGDHVVVRVLLEPVPHEVGADEPGRAGDEDPHGGSSRG